MSGTMLDPGGYISAQVMSLLSRNFQSTRCLTKQTHNYQIISDSGKYYKKDKRNVMVTKSVYSKKPLRFLRLYPKKLKEPVLRFRARELKVKDNTSVIKVGTA